MTLKFDQLIDFKLKRLTRPFLAHEYAHFNEPNTIVS
jgi:hypothetical protein